ncbi:MAG: four helix bundle protein [Gemmatimonadaceae bacterium]
MRAKATVRPSSMRHAFELASIPLRMASSGTGKSYRDLRVWDEAISLALEVYRITESFPQAERFGLTSQLRRAVVAIASNIAEGHARSTRGEYKNFLSIARGSVAEVEVQLTLAKELGYVQSPAIAKPLDLCDAISRMITNLKRAL